MKYHLVTLGCAKNTVDSMRLEQALRAGRHLAAPDPDDAELLIVNTCGFIDAAKDESIGVIRELDAQRHAGQRLYVVGCLTEIAEEQVRLAVPNVDATFGAERWDEVAADLGAASPSFDIPQPALSNIGAPSAYLKISDGCDRPCTFCIIPTIKGRMHSDPTDRLLVEARFHAAAGASELVLVAQDSTAYGEDRDERDGLAIFLERLSEAVPDLPWIRLMYAYPGRVTRRLAETMAALPNVVPYMDMPLQHASPAALMRMKRPTVQKSRESIAHIRAAMPNAVLRTTFIVGFPGETAAEFEELLAFVEEQRFEHLGAFTYSAQPGTPAAELPGQVPEAVKVERYGRLMELAQSISHEANRSVIGQEFDVLVESDAPVESAGGDLVVVGRTHRDAPEVDGLAFVKGEFPSGTMIRARVDGALPYDLLCTPVTN
ncbi:MAG: 30S ribosomal protein S12 methylthiotransferase RimO [Chloroflexi bacterium]|nr:30S ribosomal protein S12 methylthiotransferase RimO [Chloroflexota bacterium]MDA1146744.1 30S ribosomal protein S12 methylthiotransferase RimO [Chloroflexota bacterium]